MLPRALSLLRDLGLEAQLSALVHLPKYGAEFAWGDDFKTMRFSFSDGLIPGSPTFNIERSLFDQMLLEQAQNAGAEVRQETPVQRIVRLDDQDVEVEAGGQHLSARLLLDCSGQATMVARHLGTRSAFTDPLMQKVAYFQHFENVERPSGRESGHPGIVMCREGWFWLIGLSDTKTSVGFVTRPSFVKEIDSPPQRLLRWAVSRCPVVCRRMRAAQGPDTNHVLADFSYVCRPQAGPGYFLVGDAGCFLDPIFSTGVTLALVGAREAARRAGQLLDGICSPAAARTAYGRFIQQSTAVFWRLIRGYYRHSFRELFMNGQGPLQVHKAVISTLAGEVFPRPAWALRWRLRFFELCVQMQRWARLVPRHPEFSLLGRRPALA
jgi:flavin-dependent dehydrogenase